MVVTADGGLWGCGHGNFGQLGGGHRQNYSCFQRVAGPEHFQGHGVRLVIAGDLHTVVITKENRVWTCAAEQNGVLGNTTTCTGMQGRGCSDGDNAFDVLVPTLVRNTPTFVNKNIVTAAAGPHTTVVVTAQGQVYAWENAGLGHGGMQGTPRLLGNVLPTGTRIGHWHSAVEKERTLTLAMVLHHRLGKGSIFHSVPPELLGNLDGSERFDNKSTHHLPSDECSTPLRTLLGLPANEIP